MSGGGGIRGGAVGIPNNMKKTIQNIKEITGNHTDDEIYAMLKECSMDPNETAQKLLHQDTFHEVKRRKDRKKENQANREVADSRWRSGPSGGRGGRGGRGNYSSRYGASDGGSGKNHKEDGINQASNKAASITSTPVVQGGKRKDSTSSVTDMANGPIGVLSGETKQMELSSRPRAHSGGFKRSSNVSGAKADSMTVATFSGSTLDPVLVPSSDAGVPAVVGAIKREVGSQRFVVPNSNASAEHKSNVGKVGSKSHGAGKNQAAEFLQPSSAAHGSSSSSRPSSNYGSRSQQGIGSQKVVPNKEWKPKSANPNTHQRPKSPAISQGPNVLDGTYAHSQHVESVTDLEDAAKKLQQELESLHVRDSQHVIIPNHIHVPDAVRTGLSFGSFDAAFVVAPKRSAEPEIEKSKPVSVTQQSDTEKVEEQAKSHTPAEEASYVERIESPKQVAIMTSDEVPSSSVPDFNDSKETTSAPEHPSVHTSASYSFGVMPPILGNPPASTEISDAQSRDASRVPSIVVQQQLDPSSLYAQYYRSGVENNGRVSPFPTHGVAPKYSGNAAPLPSQSLPEGGNSVNLSTSAQAPLVTQAAGVMPGSIAVTQQPLPLFRQPAGVHIPHYPPNFFPYGHYFSPFYVPPPTMHQFLGNNAFPQQAQAGNVYPAPPAGAPPTAVKYPLSQYKPGSNAGNSAHMGVGGYGPYGASPAGFNPGAAPTAGNATTNEDLAASQFKESLYMTGQQSEGSAVWFPGPGRDISSLPANSFYNLPQGQHVTFAPTQAGQGAYAGIFHPGQAVSAGAVHPLLQQSQGMPGGVDMVGAAGNVYQQSQHAQMNWPNNY